MFRNIRRWYKINDLSYNYNNNSIFLGYEQKNIYIPSFKETKGIKLLKG